MDKSSNPASTSANAAAPARPLVLGTAGHIDHGKSALIEALTGVNPDRLEEEKRRGITIELGFARLDLPDGSYLGVVDVPGHERFVRQMIAGASGIDLALLCIAADDGIMPQTREHLAVLQLLGIRDCVVALTKCDLVDEEWAQMVAEEIREGLAATPYAQADIVPVSARTGQGLDELREVLARHARALRAESKEGPVRLPIDRVFTIRGAGTVVTGTLWQGEVRPEDELEVLPSHLLARVRSVQVHDQEVACSAAGNRTALNLANLKTEEVRPGDFLCTPGTLDVSDRFDANFSYLPTVSSRKPFESGARVHVAHGTREVTGRVLLMDGRETLAPQETVYAQIRLDEPLPISRGDHFVVRSYSPVHVIGGGVVLNSHPRRRTNLKPADQALLDALAKEDELAMCQAAVDSFDVPASAQDVARITGLSPARVDELLAPGEEAAGAGGAAASGAAGAAGGAAGGGAAGVAAASGAAGAADGGAKGKVKPKPKGPQYLRLGEGDQVFYAKPSVVQKHLMTIENLLLDFHAKNPTATGVSEGALRQMYPHRMDEACFDALLDRAAKQGKVVLDKGQVSHPQAGAGARKLEEQTAQTLLSALRSHGTTPPELPELFREAGTDERRGSKALLALEEKGLVERVGKTWCFTREALDELWSAAKSCLEERGQASAAELKEAMGTSRKYAIPLLEHFDDQGKTLRQGDVRVLGPRG